MKLRLKIVFGILIIFLSVFAFSCKNKKQKGNKEKQEHVAEVIYTCPMHPEVQEKEPGKCPKCGMDLVEKKSEMEHSMDEHMDE